MDAVYAWLLANLSQWPWLVYVVIVFTILGTLVDLAEKVIALTPTDSDDQVLVQVESNWFVGVLVGFLKKFSIAPKTEIQSK